MLQHPQSCDFVVWTSKFAAGTAHEVDELVIACPNTPSTRTRVFQMWLEWLRDGSHRSVDVPIESQPEHPAFAA